MGIEDIFLKCSEPKETNRQIGPLFKRWLNKNSLGVPILPKNEFLNYKSNCILDGSDSELMGFAKEKLGYKRDKGLDFVAKFINKYVIGEAKFLTDFGDNYYTQFNDAIDTLKEKKVNATIIAILDGVLYIPTNNKMYKFLKENKQHYNILSLLVLRDFLFQI